MSMDDSTGSRGSIFALALFLVSVLIHVGFSIDDIVSSESEMGCVSLGMAGFFLLFPSRMSELPVESESEKVSEFVSSTDASIIDMKNKLESKDDKEDVKASDEVGNKCSRCPKTFAHKKNVARHEKICVSQ